MKQILLQVAALSLLSSAAFAASPGLNLSWNKCTTAGPASGENFDNPCDGSAGIRSCQGSFRIATSIPDFVVTQSVIDIVFATPVPDAWKSGVADCNAGALDLVAPSTSNVTAGGNTTQCPTQLFPPGYSTRGGFVREDPAPNRLRYTADYVRPDSVVDQVSPITVNADQLYGAFAMTVDMDASTSNGCAGCNDPVCIVLVSVLVRGINQPLDNVLVTDVDVRQYVTVNGSAGAGPVCAAATPARNTTWGALKTLYR